nr:hypothetical protein [Dinoroseobacter sp.]
MRSLITPILMLIFCLPCHAATSLRSGEHPEFSRIVIDLPRIGNWSLQPSGNVYIFSAETLSPPVNTDDVFRFIPRTRIKSIEYHEQKNEIVFELECLTCAVSAFEIPEGRIVVDFKDKESKNETEVSSDKAEKERHESENKIVLEDKDLSSHSRPYSDLVSMPIFSKRQYLPHFGKVLKSDIEKEVEETNIQEWDISEELDQRLTYSSTHVEKEGMIEQIEINESESHTSQLSSMIKTTELSRVEEDNNQRHPEKGRSCVELNSLALLPIDPEYGDIADAYKKVIDARDTPKVEGLIELARVQISLGFEHEALKSIELLPIDNQYASALSAISNLLAANALSLEESEYLKKCDGDHTVWSFVV